MGDTFALHMQIEAAKLLHEQLADLVAGDPEFVRDMIEGETTLHEQIAALVASEREDRAIAEGVDRLMDRLKARKAQIEARADTKRTLITQAMVIGEIEAIETPAGRVTLKAVPPACIVTEEADIPTRFWKSPAPTLDKRALADALKARAAAFSDAAKIEGPEERNAALAKADEAHPEIPGATLSNGSRTIQIRT